MKDKENIKKELESLSPFLSQLKSDTSENKSVPKHYFANFEDRLRNRMEQESALQPTAPIPTKKNWSSWLARFWQPQYAMAFSVVLLLLAFWQWMPQQNDATTVVASHQSLLADISIEETTDYILENIQDFEMTDIATLLEEDELLTIPTPTSTSTLDQALQQIEGGDQLLDELTEEDIEALEFF